MYGCSGVGHRNRFAGDVHLIDLLPVFSNILFQSETPANLVDAKEQQTIYYFEQKAKRMAMIRQLDLRVPLLTHVKAVECHQRNIIWIALASEL